jgi:hypothetical protein
MMKFILIHFKYEIFGKVLKNQNPKFLK